MSYKEELELIGVKVNFDANYQVVVDNLKSPACLSDATVEVLYLMLNCLWHSRSTNKLVHVLEDTKCIKTYVGFKTPTECYLLDSEWGCLLQVFSCFPNIDEKFYGRKILLSKDELKQIGVVVDSDEASKKFEGISKQQASLHSIGKDNVRKMLQCYIKLKKSNSFPTNLKKCICEVKWLHIGLSDYRVPTDCILFGQCWKSISSISLIPFIDDSDNQYGTTTREYEEELKSMGVVTSFKEEERFVVNYLYLPQDPGRMTPENVYSFLECIHSYKPKNHKMDNGDRFPSSFLEKIGRQWLKTYIGYRAPQKCMLPSPEWAALFLERSDGPFLDGNYYGFKITEYANE